MAIFCAAQLLPASSLFILLPLPPVKKEISDDGNPGDDIGRGNRAKQIADDYGEDLRSQGYSSR